MSICRKHFSRFLHNLKAIYEYKHMTLGKHCLLLHKPGIFTDDVTYYVNCICIDTCTVGSMAFALNKISIYQCKNR